MEAFDARMVIAGEELYANQKKQLETALKDYDIIDEKLEILERNKKIDEEHAQQLKDIAEETKKYYEDQAKAIAEQIQQEKNLAREQLKQQKANAFNEAIDAYEALTAAENEYDAKVEKIKKDSGNVSSSVGLNTAIGTVKVAAVVDFGVQKQIDLAAQMLKEAKENNEYMQSINASVRAIASIP